MERRRDKANGSGGEVFAGEPGRLVLTPYIILTNYTALLFPSAALPSQRDCPAPSP